MAQQAGRTALCACFPALLLCGLASAGLAYAQPDVVETGSDAETQGSRAVVLQPAPPVTDTTESATADPDIQPALIQPIAIDPRWAPLKIDLKSVVLPTDAASLIPYLAAGYFPQEAQLSLAEAVAIAVKYNHDLNSQRLSAMAACKGIEINWAALKPQVSLQAKAYWQRDNSSSPSGSTSSSDDDQDTLL